MVYQSMNSFEIASNDNHGDIIELVEIDGKIESKQDSNPVPIERFPLPEPAPTTVTVETKEALVTTRELEVLRLVNIERQKDGKKPLTYLSDLEKGANIRALDIIELWSHKRPNGTQFFTAFEYLNYSKLGENLASGPKTPKDAVAMWMKSGGHRENILNDEYEQMAIAVSEDAEGKLYWVQILYRGR